LKKHHPQYAPELGNRYDGIYKIVRYFPEIGKSGFRVYRYELRRDDPIPAPWTKRGKDRIRELGLKMVYPETYDRDSGASPKTKDISKLDRISYEEIYREPSPSPSILGKRKRLHNPLATLDTFPDVAVVVTSRPSQQERQPSSRAPASEKTATFNFPLALQELIDADTTFTPSHQRLWRSITDQKPADSRGFSAALECELKCPVCLGFVRKPVTNPCGHIACLTCMKTSVDEYGPKCPNCRASLVEIEGSDAGDGERNPKLKENMKRIWKNQVQVDDRLVDVIRYIQGYGK
jgi:E3 ubiquitin-protein ligase UHRF1